MRWLARVLPVVATLLGLAGCGHGSPTLGTTDVCSLFDADVLAGAVPDGQVSVSALNSYDDDGASGVCELSNLGGVFPRDSDFGLLRLEIRKMHGTRSAEQRDWAANLLRTTCERVFEQPHVQPGQPPAERSCASVTLDADMSPPSKSCDYGAIRGGVAAWGYFLFPATAPQSEIDRNCRVTRQAVDSRLTRW
jgi:hypothetical protein